MSYLAKMFIIPCHWMWPGDSIAPPAGTPDSYMHIHLWNSVCVCIMTRRTNKKVCGPKPSVQQEARHLWQQLVSDGGDGHVFRAASVASGFLGNGYPWQDFLFCALIIVSSPISNLRGENGVKSSANWFWDYMSVNAFCLVSPKPARRWWVRITPTETKTRISTYSHQLHPNIHPFTHRESHSADLHWPPKGRGNFRRTDCPTSRGSHRASGLCQPADTHRSGLIRRPRPHAERQALAAASEDQREPFPLTAT